MIIEDTFGWKSRKFTKSQLTDIIHNEVSNPIPTQTQTKTKISSNGAGSSTDPL